jgi:hypothetical protein
MNKKPSAQAFLAAMQGVERIVRAPINDGTVTNRDRLDAASFLRLAILILTFAVFLTEFLSPFHLLSRWPLASRSNALAIATRSITMSSTRCW